MKQNSIFSYVERNNNREGVNGNEQMWFKCKRRTSSEADQM